MALRYSRAMPVRQTMLPLLWLLSDARNDAALENALTQLPPGSGFVFRHYHLDAAHRAVRFANLARAARKGRHVVILADDARTAIAWGADGVYGESALSPGTDGLIRLATAHDGEELGAASAADGVFLSPVFPTRSHDGAPTLGIHGFHVLAQQATIPVIALGGMTADRARALQWPRWGAIDGLVPTLSPLDAGLAADS